MKKWNWKSFVAGIIMTVLLITATSAFAESRQAINAIFGRVKLKVNGRRVDEPTLLYNGITYVPLRAISEMLGKNVIWDKATNTAHINDKATTQLPIANQEIKWQKDIAEEEVIDRFSTSEAEVDGDLQELLDGKETDIDGIVDHSDEYNKITKDWISTHELKIMKNISFSMIGVNDTNKSIQYAFFRGHPYEKIYELEISQSWDGEATIVKNIRIKRIDGTLYFFVDDLVKSNIIDGR